MANKEQRKTAKSLLKALDDTIQKGPWEKTVFLSAIGKKLREIRTDFKNRLSFLDPGFDEFASDEEETASLESPKAQKSQAVKDPLPGYTQAFVSLYNADGMNIKKWEKLLLSLDKQVVTRPIYAEEKQIRALMRAKANRKNDAYTAFYVQEGDIIQPKDGHAPLDRLGNPLLILKDGALKIENITHFFHETGIYILEDKQLRRVGNMDYMETE